MQAQEFGTRYLACPLLVDGEPSYSLSFFEGNQAQVFERQTTVAQANRFAAKIESAGSGVALM